MNFISRYIGRFFRDGTGEQGYIKELNALARLEVVTENDIIQQIEIFTDLLNGYEKGVIKKSKRSPRAFHHPDSAFQEVEEIKHPLTIIIRHIENIMRSLEKLRALKDKERRSGRKQKTIDAKYTTLRKRMKELGHEEAVIQLAEKQIRIQNGLLKAMKRTKVPNMDDISKAQAEIKKIKLFLKVFQKEDLEYALAS